ncbi:hypothetical protein FKM82_004469 [Ascaphus truei]
MTSQSSTTTKGNRSRAELTAVLQHQDEEALGEPEDWVSTRPLTRPRDETTRPVDRSDELSFDSEPDFDQLLQKRLSLFGLEVMKLVQREVEQKCRSKDQQQQRQADRGRAHYRRQGGCSNQRSLTPSQAPHLGFNNLSNCDETSEDIDGYLQFFGRTCCLHDEPRGVPDDLCKDYGGVGQYAITEMYRIKFRTLERGPNETYVEFAMKLARYFERWITSSGARTMEDLMNLFTLEQFFECCPPEVKEWVRARMPSTPIEAANLADKCVEERPYLLKMGPTNMWQQNTRPTKQPQPSQLHKPLHERQCYQCGHYGHLVRNCPEERRLTAPAKGNRKAGGRPL